MNNFSRENMTPMNINEAVESMKILQPYEDVLNRPGVEMVDILKGFMDGLIEDGTQPQALRLVALMYHMDVEKVAEYLKAEPSFTLSILLANGFEMNSLTNLLGTAKMLKVGE